MPRLGKVTLTAGQYAYVGSAHGPGGLRARVGRHLRVQKPRHWHIDYLTAEVPVQHVFALASAERLECTWVARLLGLNGADVPAPGFGSSDCRRGCPAHLLRLPDGLIPSELEDVLDMEPGSEFSERTPGDTTQTLLDAISAGDDAAAERMARACASQTALLPALRPLLADADPDRRWWGARALAAVGGAEAADMLIACLRDTDVATQCAAALGLGQLRATTAIPALAALLSDANGWVRDTAADALAMIGEPALSVLVETLSAGQDGARVRAAGALRKISVSALADRRITEFEPQFWPALNALFAALNDPNRLVRHHAYAALDRLDLLDTVIIPA
jgi:Uri superfamily endonuclease